MGGRRERLVDAFNRRIGERLGFWLTMTRPGFPAARSQEPGDLRFVRVSASSGVGIEALSGAGFIHLWPLRGSVCHPWVHAIRQEREGHSRIEEQLASYYSAVQPRDALDWLGLDEQQAPGLVGVPAYAAVRPWSLEPIRHRVDEAKHRHLRERRGYRLGANDVLGNPSFGPLATAQIEAEAEKLRRLARLLSQHDLDCHRVDYDVAAVVLESDGEVRWVATSGRHRVAVVAALGLNTIPLSVRMFIRRAEVETWPHVRSGTYSREGALKVFDHHFTGQGPSVGSPWVRDAQCAKISRTRQSAGSE